MLSYPWAGGAAACDHADGFPARLRLYLCPPDIVSVGAFYFAIKLFTWGRQAARLFSTITSLVKWPSKSMTGCFRLSKVDRARVSWWEIKGVWSDGCVWTSSTTVALGWEAPSRGGQSQLTHSLRKSSPYLVPYWNRAPLQCALLMI